MFSVDQIRQSFLDFFAERSSQIEPSASLIPVDPSILFTIAGMVPFKKMFLGLENKGYTRAASCQRCIRTNDLDNVGRTARHHTFFEMLGNFSFGDYFKPDAIRWGWEFITEVMKIDPARLWITIYTDDDEAYRIWKDEVGVSPGRIVRLGEEDNFWRMGETGPCGPCSEILIDLGEDRGCGKPTCAVGCDCDRFLELWNLVFTQYDCRADGMLSPLPMRNIDTGLGLERLASVIQGKDNNYEIDNILPIIEYTARLSNIRYKQDEASDVAWKVIADHVRAATFLISDGVFPANEGRGYVLRRLIRRAIQNGRKLGLKNLFLFQLVGVVVDLMKRAYPELVEKREHISQVVKSEEERFSETLEIGSAKVTELLDSLRAKNIDTIPGIEAFKLYDTYGFPLDLTREIAHDEDFKIDVAGFEQALAEQKTRARGATGFSHEEAENPEIYGTILTEIGPTEFLGYDNGSCRARLLRILHDNKEVSRLTEGQEGVLLLDRSPFYAESGGQRGDSGSLRGADSQVLITDVHKYGGGLFLHLGKVTHGIIDAGMDLTAEVDAGHRQATAVNHTATHLLQAALRKVLGNHIKQSGSLVTATRLRFDFTHPAALHERELKKVEELVNEWIRADSEVNVSETSYDEAVKSGALAFFGEKYDQVVRSVSVGEVSTELCGGTHCRRSGEIGLFKITSESGIAAGIRRIEGLAGYPAWQKSVEEEKILHGVSGLLGVSVHDLEEKVAKLLKEIKQKDKLLEELATRQALSAAGDLLDRVKPVNEVKCLMTIVEGVNAKQLRSVVDDLKNRLGSGLVLLFAPRDEGVAIVLGVTKDLTGRLNAGKLIAAAAQVLGGRGGGRPDFAQAGGKDKTKIPQAMEAVEELIKQS